MSLATVPPLRRDLWLLLVLLLPYFLLMTGARPLNIPDEGRYPEVAREMLLTGDFVTPRNNGIVFMDKPALYYWLQAAAMAVFGVEVWSIRLVPALFGVFGCVAT
ncbi:MAG: arnT 1, partial [Moraxellaceae bacterium]|nr:arnT 1 [Moraxellaceae bacterium]